MYTGLKVCNSEIMLGELGLMTLRDIPLVGEEVGEYTGSVRAPDYESESVYMARLASGSIIDANNSQDGIVRFINDCKDDDEIADRCEGLNCRLVDGGATMTVQNTRPIPKNEELYLSYGDGFWDEDEGSGRRARGKKCVKAKHVGVKAKHVKGGVKGGVKFPRALKMPKGG
jgi:hypothetical protein